MPSPSATACASCGAPLEASDAFCATCGHPNDELWTDLGGFVENGRWVRPPSEFARRIELDQMRQGLGRATIVVPNGSIGAVSVDGAVQDILRPGKRTTVTWLDQLVGLFTDKLDRTAFYLIDLRPIPIPLSFDAPVPGRDTTVKATATLMARVDRSSATSLSTFIQGVIRERERVTQRDLHALIAREASQLARQLVLTGLQQHPDDLDTVATSVASQLNDRIGTRLGLELEVRLDLSSIRSVDVHLGTGELPSVRHCSSCDHEVPGTNRFCPACGVEQPLSARRCQKCSDHVRDGDQFCQGCGQEWTDPPAAVRALFTADGQQVEIDLVVRIQGLTDDRTTERVREAVAALVAAELRHHELGALSSRQGFQELADALTTALGQQLESVGVGVREVAILDVRSKTGEWLLGARAEIEATRQRLLVGREWLGVEADQLSLQELVYGVVLRRRRMELSQTFALREAAVAARERDASLDDREADLSIQDAQRTARQEVGSFDAGRDAERHRTDADHADAIVSQERTQTLDDGRLRGEIGQERLARDFAVEGERQASELASEKARREAADRAAAERLQRDVAYDDDARRETLQVQKLRAMAEMDRDTRKLELDHQKELADKELSPEQLIAIQAADLAGKEHGDAAFEALEGRRVAEARKEAAGELRDVMQQMLDMQQRTVESALAGQSQAQAAASRAHEQSAEHATGVAERSMESMSRVAASAAAPAPVVAGAQASAGGPPCKECAAELKAPYRFCGVCGTAQ